MKKALTAIAIGALVLGAGVARAAEDGGHDGGSEGEGASTDGTPLMKGGDPKAGESLAGTCVGCHGPKGNSPQGQWPNLAGQHAGYIYKQLADLKAGEERSNPQMAGMVGGLSEQDMRDLAAYYAGQPHKTQGAGDEELVARGREIYMGGLQHKGVAACVSCHGPRGRGNPGADYPVVGGQWGQYLQQQLQQFRSGKRANDPEGMMRSLAAEMTDEEIRAVSEYMSGLN